MTQDAGSARAVASAAARATPLAMVSGAIAGDDVQSVAQTASDALARAVAIALPALGGPVVWPAHGAPAPTVRAVSEYAAAVIRGEQRERPGEIAAFVPIRIRDELAGIVAALGASALDPAQRAWLDAAAAAAAVAALMRESQNREGPAANRALLESLADGAPKEPEIVIAHARRNGIDLSSGAVALAARVSVEDPARIALAGEPHVMLAHCGGERVLGLAANDAPGIDLVVERLRSVGASVALSSPCRDATALHDALREAELLVQLAADPAVALSGQEDTFRLLIGVLLRDREELERLRARTVLPLEHYDAEHAADLLATLRVFLAHHGSTTDTADTMRLHRHTVGYRLARVADVSGLSPYESDGRERLSLGLKAHQILQADIRRDSPG